MPRTHSPPKSASPAPEPLPQRHHCTICGGIRPCADGVCLGCGGSARTPAGGVPPKPARTTPCPRCGTFSRSTLEPGRYCCRNCQAVYEADDFGFVDDRPDINAEKRERQELLRRQRARSSRAG